MTLSRRNFIGGAVASASVARYLGAATTAHARSLSDQGIWARRGMIDAGGSHEPYLFVVRRGGQRLDARQTCDYEQSEELIRELAGQGVEVFHTHLYKGFGMEAEREGMEETRRTVEIVHRMGMKADTYIQWNSMMYETFFFEEPRAVQWIQRDVSGLPILLPYGYQQSFRYRPCFSNQDYLEYLKKIVRYAVVEVKTDFIHFDNFDLNAEPDSCHCAACVAGFRAHLSKKYTAAQLLERFGFERVDYVNPPQWNSDNPPAKIEIIFDPALQEWMDYRCQSMADALEQMYTLISSLNHNVAIEINPGGITGENRPWQSGIDHRRLLKFTSAFWSEEENEPGYHAEGGLITKIRSYKLARAYENVLFTYIENDAVAMAEALAFNQSLGFVGSNPLSAITREHIEFYCSNKQMYEESVDAGNVAVMRSYASLAYNNASVQLCTVLVEQTLIQSSVPFDLIFDDGLAGIERYRVLILPDTECLSDADIAIVRRFVEGGGSLIVIGQAGLYDEWRRVRVTPGLHGMVDHQMSGTEYQERVEARQAKPVVMDRKQVGRGKVGYLSAMEFDGPMPPPTPNFAITSQYWKRPKNWHELIDLTQWGADNRLPLVLDAPDGVVGHCTVQMPKRRMLVHLVNYDFNRNPKAHAIHIRLVVPDEAKPCMVLLHVPGAGAAVSLDFTSASNRISFTVGELSSYALISVAW